MDYEYRNSKNYGILSGSFLLLKELKTLEIRFPDYVVITDQFFQGLENIEVFTIWGANQGMALNCSDLGGLKTLKSLQMINVTAQNSFCLGGLSSLNSLSINLANSRPSEPMLKLNRVFFRPVSKLQSFYFRGFVSELPFDTFQDLTDLRVLSFQILRQSLADKIFGNQKGLVSVNMECDCKPQDFVRSMLAPTIDYLRSVTINKIEVYRNNLALQH